MSDTVKTHFEIFDYANGHTVDRRGRLVSCEHGGRQVTRTEPDGSITVLGARYPG